MTHDSESAPPLSVLGIYRIVADSAEVPPMTLPTWLDGVGVSLRGVPA